jgi:predicted O-methyltransferase YrrM
MISKIKKWLGFPTNLPIEEKKVAFTPYVIKTTFPTEGEWYPPTLLPISEVGRYAASNDCLQKSLTIIDYLEQDKYTLFVKEYCNEGMARYGEEWYYADITTAIYSAAKFINPVNYLEIGVRRGRSLAMVAASNPKCNIVAADTWPEFYANIPNPGPDFVIKEMSKIGYHGQIDFVNGDSHKTIPEYFSNHPDMFFDLITVDGDHSEEGAKQDLLTVLPRLKVGGIIVFDDISHPLLPHLREVWNQIVASDFHFSTWEYDELGFGVAIAIRRSA